MVSGGDFCQCSYFSVNSEATLVKHLVIQQQNHLWKYFNPFIEISMSIFNSKEFTKQISKLEMEILHHNMIKSNIIIRETRAKSSYGMSSGKILGINRLL